MSAVGNALAWPFRNPEERRLRWGWRVFIPVFLSIVLLFVGGMTAVLLAPLLAPLAPGFPFNSQYLARMVLPSLVVLAILPLWARFVDRRRIADYGFHIDRGWFVHLLGGMVIGAFIPITTLLVLLALGWATVAHLGSIGVAFVLAFIVGFLASLLNGLWEEALYRGVALKNGAEGLRSMGVSPRLAVVGALLIVSLAFTLFHVLLGGFSTFPYYVVSAISLGLVYILTGELAFAIGYHAIHNYFSAVVFPKDFSPGGTTLLGLELSGSAPEAFVGVPQLLQIPILCAAMVLMLLWVRWRKGDLKLKTDLTEWTPRGADKPHGSGRVR